MATRLPLIIILLILFTIGYSQKDTRAVLEIYGGTEEFCVTKSGAIWIATKTGNTYYTNDISKPWHSGELNFGTESVTGKTFERASFFNSDTGFISGFIINDEKFEIGKNSNYNLIYRTTDKGYTWKPVDFGGSSWIDACYIDEKGYAWMSGSSQEMYQSDDFGTTWVNKGKIVDRHGFRLRSIYFADYNNGIIGTFGNDLYRTENNCETWNKIETPLDQKKYTRIYAGSRPEFNKILLFHDWIIVNQEGKIFYTKENKIEWKELSGCIDFSYDKHNDKLWIVNIDLNVRRLNHDLSVIWTSNETLTSPPLCIYAANNYLYSWFRQDICRVNENEFYETSIYTTDIKIQPPVITAKATFITWGVYANEIYHSDDQGQNWYRIKRFPFDIGNFKALNDSLCIISDYKYRFYQFNSKSGKYSPYLLSHPLNDFFEYPIEKVIFQTGSQGCFHSYATTINYELKKDTLFVVKQYEKADQQKELPNSYKNTFGITELKHILLAINDNPFQKVRLTDFNVNEEDKGNYLKQISVIEKDFKQGKGDDYPPDNSKFNIPFSKVDFTFYKNYVDSLPFINDSIINELLLSPQKGWSTTTNWISIKIINEHKDEIVIENSAYEPNAWFLPWLIRYDDYVLASLNIDITKFIKKNSPGFIMDKDNMNDYLIFQIVNAMYLKELNQK
jgi:photosystem II stability/assembly factor-like uncharacterized protein